MCLILFVAGSYTALRTPAAAGPAAGACHTSRAWLGPCIHDLEYIAPLTAQQDPGAAGPRVEHPHPGSLGLAVACLLVLRIEDSCYMDAAIPSS